MGCYTINCSTCNKPYMWFSGIWDQRCGDCMGAQMTTKQEPCATCGHNKSQHIYEEGACRPGFVCEKQCEKFKPMTTKQERVSDKFILLAIAEYEKHIEHYRKRPSLYKAQLEGDERGLSVLKELQELRALLPKIKEAVGRVQEACLCSRNTYGFDYGEIHPIIGKPGPGKRWLTPNDLSKDLLTLLDEVTR